MAPVLLGSFVVSRGAAVMQTTGGVRYAVVAGNTQNSIAVIHAIESSPVSVTSSSATIHGTASSIGAISAVISSDDKIHILSSSTTNSTTRDVAYCIYDCSTDAFGTWEEASAYGAANSEYWCSIDLDSSDKPHIVYVTPSGSFYAVEYRNKVSGSWSSAEVVSVSTTKTFRHPDVLVRDSDIVEVQYDNLTDGINLYRTRTSGVWGSETTIINAGQPNSFNQTSTTGGTVYRYNSELTGVYNLRENGSDTGIDIGGNTRNVWSALASTTRFVFWVDNAGSDVKVTRNSGSGWSISNILQVGTFTNVVCSWSYRNWNAGPSRLDYVFGTGSQTWYDSFDPSTPAPDGVQFPAAIGGALRMRSMISNITR